MMDGIHNDHASEGSRRQFLKTAAAAGGAAAVASADSVWARAPASTVPTVTLGKTGQKVPVLGMGTSWDLSPSFVQAALHAGVRYIDTSESYEDGNCETTLGEVLERTKMRKDVYLVTKNSRGKVGGSRAFADLRETSRRRAWSGCGPTTSIATTSTESTVARSHLLSDPGVKAAFEKLKKAGKIKFCGLSCHDARLPEIVTAAAESGWMDQIMIQYNYRTMTTDAVKRALDAASKANLAIVAMKTQGGAGRFQEATASPKFKEFVDKGFKSIRRRSRRSSPTTGSTPSSAR